MTDQDKVNFDIIDDIVTRVWGFDDNSLDYFRREIRNPTLDPAYQIVGPDLRVRWPIKIDDPKIGEIQKRDDKGWDYFSQAFRAPVAFADIGYQNYLSNKMLVGKNEIKLKKVIMDYYENNKPYFIEHYVSDYIPNGMSKRDIMKIAADNKAFMDVVEKYIIKAFEVIGKYKSPKKDFELVLSMNFADWFLCSTKQTWSSCLNLDGGGYWRGIASLIGDKNRGFLYIANGKKKNFKGIIVDEVVSRTWVLLDKDNFKNIVKFYPNEFLSVETIKKVSGDDKFRMVRGDYIEGKREIEPVVFKKAKTFMTIYNDACAIDERKLKETKKLFPLIGKRGCFQYLSYGSDRLGDIEPGDMLSRVDRYLETKKSINDFIVAYMCNECGAPINREYAKRDRKGNYYCEKCAAKVLKTCENCGNKDHVNSMKEFVRANGSKFTVCSRCADEVVRCDCCGDITVKQNTVSVVKKDENGNKVTVRVCGNCTNHVEKCKYCGDNHYKKDLFTFKPNETTAAKKVCWSCFANKDENTDFIGYDVCFDCRNIYKIEELIYDHRAQGYCIPCVKKAIDKKQLKFTFIK